MLYGFRAMAWGDLGIVDYEVSFPLNVLDQTIFTEKRKRFPQRHSADVHLNSKIRFRRKLRACRKCTVFNHGIEMVINFNVF